MKPLLEGQDLRPDNLKSDWFEREGKMGSWQCFWKLFPCACWFRGTSGYYNSTMLLFMHAVGFHCPWCPTNCGMRTCHRLLEAAWEKMAFSSLFMAGSWPRWLYWLQSCLAWQDPFYCQSLSVTICRNATVWYLFGKHFSTHNGSQIKENPSIDLHKLPPVQEGFHSVHAVCLYIWSVLSLFGTTDCSCLLITQAAALLLFEYTYRTPSDYTALNSCLKYRLACSELLNGPASYTCAHTWIHI